MGSLRTTAALRRVSSLVLMVGFGCRPVPQTLPPSETVSDPPAWMMGAFIDDYQGRHLISAKMWVHQESARYRVIHWDVAGRFLIAKNDPENPTDGGLWTRIDWVTLVDGEPYGWAFCLSAYDAPTRLAAESTQAADREHPRTGCNGFPFSRMARMDAPGPTASRPVTVTETRRRSSF